ncbi:hypothetical protein HN51_024496 [Arachis hypogaea]|uniref:uncharacterized protein n=1 Tax=Arachis hypogaea TaxID=3818 RepID=UPI0010FC4401|nr:uncharacterized protein LOC112701164 [Arachis hypogaea]QHO27539.1 Ankyrin repeat-containing protein [Arachis hypogaea]
MSISGGASSTSSAAITDCDELGIVVAEEAEHVRERIFWGSDNAYKRQIYKAAITGDWSKALRYNITDPTRLCCLLTKQGDTALHIAVSMEQTSFVENLIDHMSLEDMQIRKVDGNTAFSMAAISGNLQIAKLLLHKNPGLVWIKGHKNMLPIELACWANQPLMVNYLFENTRLDYLNRQLLSIEEDIVRVFFLALTTSNYSVASSLLDMYSELATAENNDGLTALEVIAKLPSEGDEAGYRDIVRMVFEHMEGEEFECARISKAMFDAAKLGNDIILEFMFGYNANLLMEVNSKGQSLLHIAILNRRVTTYQLILRKGAYTNAILQFLDFKGNNILHYAGKLSAAERFGTPCHSLLLSEERWFQEVASIVPGAFKNMKNVKGRTPEEIFYKKHKELHERAMSEQNKTANNFMIIGTLVTTLAVTAALTIRTNTVQGPTPVFKEITWYILFLLSVVVVTTVLVLSMLFFTSVIHSPRKQKMFDQVNARHRKIAIRCLLLFLFIITITFTALCSAVLIFSFFPKWIFIFIIALSSVPLVFCGKIYGFATSISLLVHKNDLF